MTVQRTIKRTEARRRGLLGWFFLLLFWGFNALMLYVLVMTVGENAEQSRYLTGAARQGFEMGTGIAIMIMLFFWAAGAVVFGSMAYFTRGKLVVTEQIIEDTRPRR
jgi:hypothetical protein